MIDTGADYSIFRYDVAKDGLNIPVDSLQEEKIPVSGISGSELSTVKSEISLAILCGDRSFIVEKLPVRIITDPTRQPKYCLLGRNPFFYDYRVDFRMGYTDDKKLGKFIIYPEKKKRKAKNYNRPLGITVRR